MKNNIAVTTQDISIDGSLTGKSPNRHFRELTQAEIEYAMRKEDMFKAALVAQRRMQSGSHGQKPWLAIKPGPGSSMI